MRKLFRALVICTIVAQTLYWSMPYVDYMWLSIDHLALLDQGGLGASIPPSEAFHWLTLCVWVLVSIGLYFYVGVARTAFVVLYVISAVLGLFYGIQVLTPVEMLLANVMALADGAIISIMYFTSVAEAFRDAS